MLDACPHHHEDETVAPADATVDVEADLDGVNLRSPRTSRASGHRTWRTLDELAGTPAFETMLHREFPHAAGEWNDEASRRHFLKLMGASLALAGLSACTLRKTEEKVVPYVNPPEQVIPGRPLFFASSYPWCGYAKGVVVESHEGRPTNVQGNADHLKALAGFPGDKADPNTLGSSDIWVQGSILDMYDPDRSQNVMWADDTSSWGKFVGETGKVFADKAKRVRFLTGTVTSPTLARLINAFLAASPQSKWHQYDSVNRNNAAAGAVQAFGKDQQAVYRYDQASIILSLEDNFLMDSPGSLIYSRQFVAGRRIRQGEGPATMNRLYVVESNVTITGAQSDHRLAVKSADVESIARRIAAAVNGKQASGDHARWINAVAADLKANAGKCLVTVGESQPAAVHALAYALNDALGNVGKTVGYIDPVAATGPGGPLGLTELVRDCEQGLVDVLVVMGTNPVYTAPVSLGLRHGLDEPMLDDRNAAFKKHNPLAKVPLIVHHGAYGARHDETATFAHWHVPASSWLESWGDLRAYDGTASLVQPLIEPLYTTKSEIELAAFIAGQGDVAAHDLVRQTWSVQSVNRGGDAFDTFWDKALEKGVVPNTASPTKNAPLAAKLADAIALEPTTRPGAAAALEINFRLDPHVLDGRYANNGWLQELPKPVTLITWENVALMSWTMAKKLRLPMQSDQGRGSEVPKVEVKFNGQAMVLPAVILPGHADDSITVYLGYGRHRTGTVSKGLGVDAYAVRPSDDTWFGDVESIVPRDEFWSVATSQSHHLIDLPSNAADADKLDDFWLGDRGLVRTKLLSDLGREEPSDDAAYAKATNQPAPATENPLRTIKLRIHSEGTDPAQTLLPSFDYNHGDPAKGIVADPHFNKWGMVIDNQACIGCNACVIACQSENNIAIVGKEQILRGREMHWLRIDTYFQGHPEDHEPDATPTVYFQPIPCMQCENAPCTLVCPVEATTISAEGINEMTYNRCVGTRYCSNNCPYKVRRFNFMEWSDYETPQYMLQRNPNVTVRARGVMEKCNYCVQRINNGRIEAKRQDRPINPGEVVTACAQACPTQAITFGNLNDTRWEVTRLQKEPLRYTLLDGLNTQPRTSYLARVRNPNPELVAAGEILNQAKKG